MAPGLTERDYLREERGWRQRDLTVRQVYDRGYLDERYAAIDERVRGLARKRLAVLGAFVPVGGRLLDFGCGTGRLVQEAVPIGWNAWGHDLVPGEGRRIQFPIDQDWEVACFFDSLEHLRDPDETIASIGARWVMVSVPWCHHPSDWSWFGPWKHRRPGEHLWHWDGFTLDRFFGRLGYAPFMHSSFEDEWRPNPAQDEPNILTAIYRRKCPSV